jgi:integrase
VQRVRHHRYLYLRGGAWVFRRAVPPAHQAAFGTTEVFVTLKASNLAEARLAMQPHLDSFERKLRLAAEGALESVTGSIEPDPALVEIEAVVRRWLAERMERFARAGMAPDDEAAAVARLSELERYREDVAAGLMVGRPSRSQMNDWIVQAIKEQRGWKFDERSAAHRNLRRTVARAQLEASRREEQDILGAPRCIVDATFAPEEYRLDQEMDRANPKRSVTLRALFDGYVAERDPAPATVKAWKRQLEAFITYLGHQDAANVMIADVVGWKEHLLTGAGSGGRRLSAKTVKDTYLSVIKTIYRWGYDNGKVRFNPAQKVSVLAPRKQVTREKGLNDQEAIAILKATLTGSPPNLSEERKLARRWVPWICAYSGARVNEITQLRAEDVYKVRGVWVIRITPEAGSTKTQQARTVAIHPHLLEQGFPAVVEGKSGPLFYDPGRYRGGSSGNPQAKKVGEYLARWVREIGVTDVKVMPNHGWRHRFKTQARLANMDPEIRDVIQGHSPRTVGEAYGDTFPEVSFREIAKLPAYRTD